MVALLNLGRLRHARPTDHRHRRRYDEPRTASFEHKRREQFVAVPTEMIVSRSHGQSRAMRCLRESQGSSTFRQFQREVDRHRQSTPRAGERGRARPARLDNRQSNMIFCLDG
jgi:hypothetical protein